MACARPFHARTTNPLCGSGSSTLVFAVARAPVEPRDFARDAVLPAMRTRYIRRPTIPQTLGGEPLIHSHRLTGYSGIDMNDTVLTARFANRQEIDDWDTLVAENPTGGEFLASSAFATTKAAVGWVPRHLVFESGGHLHSVALVLEYRVPMLGALWYIARGPAAATQKELAQHVAAIRDCATRLARHVFAVTLEPPVIAPDPEHLDDEPAPELSRLGFVRRPYIQGNRHTAIVQIDRSDDELIASFDKKCRNMIRRAQRDGAVVRQLPATHETYEDMHRLMRLVGGGKAELMLRSRDYTERLWHEFAAAGQGRFYAIDGSDGRPAVMGYLIRVGTRAFYKDGGSERDRVTPGMSNLLLWQMMLDARDDGATEIDLFGVAPAWATSTQDHPSFGLGLFKLSFSRERTDYIGAFDLVLRPGAYRIWRRIGERVVGAIHRRRYNDLTIY